MKREIYDSILKKLSKVAPLFAKSVLEKAISSKGHTQESISAAEMLEILTNEVNPKLSKEKVTSNSILLSGAGYLITNEKEEIIFKNSQVDTILKDIRDKGSFQSSDSDFHLLVENGFCKRVKDAYDISVYGFEYLGKFFNVSIVPNYNQEGKITGVVSVIQDITLHREIENEVLSYSKKLNQEIERRIQSEKELKDKHEMLIESSRMASLGEMASGIAHEINNPLAMIGLNIDLIYRFIDKSRLTEDILKDKMSKIVEAGERINNIIIGMKRLTRPTDELQFETFQICDIIHNVLNICSERFKLANVNLTLTGDFENIMIKGRDTEIGQVLINILNNAYDEILDRFPSPWVEIDVFETQFHIVIAVTDCGEGIPIEVEKKMFNPFFTTKLHQGGTGLGMSISKKIIENHNGTIKINRDSPNTRIEVSLPKV